LNLAAALLMLGEMPIVADFRLGAGTIGLMLGQEQSAGMANVLAKPTAEILSPMIERELFVHSSNVRALLSSAKPKESLLRYSTESALAVVKGLRILSRPAVVDLGAGYSDTINQLQREMDQLILVVDPFDITLSMARSLLRELENTDAGSGRIHIVVVDRSDANVQIPWNEVEQMLGREIRAIISDAPDLVQQALKAATPMVMLQPNSIFANQITKLAEDLNTRIRTLANGQPAH
jgi:MinD-like ATPase involved in chromosome partitioning or flagellar assembly